MTRFIDEYESQREAALADITSTEELIVGLLEHTSRTMDRVNNLPTEAGFEEMKDDLDFKARQMESSRATQQRLLKEKAKLEADLKRVKHIEPEIEKETTKLLREMKEMKDAMVVYGDIEQLKERSEMARDLLIDMKQGYKKRREAIKKQTAPLQSEYERLKSRLASDDCEDAESMQKDMRSKEQNIYKLETFIEERSRETDFQSQKEECGRIIDELNAIHIHIATNGVGA